MAFLPLSRRGFLSSIGASGAGLLTLPLVSARGNEALYALDRAESPVHPPGPSSLIRLDSNENPVGAGPRVIAAIRSACDQTNRYPTTSITKVKAAIATARGVTPDNLMLGCGSGEVLRVAVQAFTGPTQSLVIAAPTFEATSRTATVMGAQTHTVPVDAKLRLDLDAMAEAAVGAGLVYVCNPNNPTSTVHGDSDIRAFVDRVGRVSPQTMILIDEAYHEYVDDPSYASAIPLAMANPHVVVARTFSKVYGMAGLRLGYAIGQPATLAKMTPWLLSFGANQLVLVAAEVAVADTAHIAGEQKRNRAARAFTLKFFTDAGYTTAEAQANFVMADVRRDVTKVITDCHDHGVAVGRVFPALPTHLRVSIGTMPEMERAVDVFRKVLASPT